jgi:hypothetical protein
MTARLTQTSSIAVQSPWQAKIPATAVRPALALLAGTSAAARGCSHGFRFCDNCDVHVTFFTKKNTACTQRYSAGGTSAILGQAVTKRPRGVFGVSSQVHGAYQPPPNYVGDDYFEVRINYERTGTKLFTTLKVNVKIRD